jgi:hypothetical protein
MHLSLSPEADYLTGEKPVSMELVKSVLLRQLDDLEPPSRAMVTASRIWSSSSMLGPIRLKLSSVTRLIQNEPRNSVTGC